MTTQQGDEVGEVDRMLVVGISPDQFATLAGDIAASREEVTAERRAVERPRIERDGGRDREAR